MSTAYNTIVSANTREEETIISLLYCVTHDGHPSSINRPPIRMIPTGNVVPFFEKTNAICNSNHFYKCTMGWFFLFVIRI